MCSGESQLNGSRNSITAQSESQKDVAKNCISSSNKCNRDDWYSKRINFGEGCKTLVEERCGGRMRSRP